MEILGSMFIAGSATITKIMDLIGNMLPDKYRKLIPYIACLFGILWMTMSPNLELREIIERGVSMGLGAVGIHVITKKKEPKLTEEEEAILQQHRDSKYISQYKSIHDTQSLSSKG